MADNVIFERPDTANINSLPSKSAVVVKRRVHTDSSATDTFFADPANSRVAAIVQAMEFEQNRDEAAMPGLWEALQEAGREDGGARAELAALKLHYYRRNEDVPADKLAVAEAKVARTSAKREMHQVDMDKAARRINWRRQALLDIYGLINSNGGRPFIDHIVAPLPSDELTSVQGLRDKEKTLRAHKLAIKNAPLPLPEARAALHRQVDETISGLMPYPMVTPTGVSLQFAQFTLSAAPSVGFDLPQMADTRGLALMANKDAVLAHLDARLEQQYAKIKVVARPKDKDGLLAAVDAEILELQRVEVATLAAAKARGIDIEMRQVDPRALISVDGRAPRVDLDRVIEDDIDDVDDE